jgi:hypothetical protein
MSILRSVRLNRRRTIELPSRIFKPSDRVAIFTEGDTVIVKKMAVTKLSEIASRSPGRPMSPSQIAREIERYRKEKRK